MDNKLKIIGYLGKNIGRSYTMHELSQILRIPYASFYRTTHNLQDIIIRTRKGQAYLIELNSINPIIKSYLTIASDEEKKEFLNSHQLLGKLRQEFSHKEVVVLFGSYAKGKETEDSDIDLLIINSKGRKTASFSKFETLFKKRVNPLFITPTEFRRMLKDKEENVGKQVLKNHVILNNQEKFWELVL